VWRLGLARDAAAHEGRTIPKYSGKESPTKVTAPAKVRGTRGFPRRENTRSVLPLSRTTRLRPNCRGLPYTAEVQPANVHRQSYKILSPRVEKVPGASTGLGPLHKSKVRSHPRICYVLDCQSVRDGRSESSEGLLYRRRGGIDTVC
jgi:hypothetical protein